MIDYASKLYWENMVKMSLSRYFVLYALNQQSMHGYDITRWIDKMTCGCCCPTEGSLYPMLREFEKGGYISGETISVSGRERKVYTINEKGTDALRIATEVWGHTAKLLLDSMQPEKNPE